MSRWLFAVAVLAAADARAQPAPSDGDVLATTTDIRYANDIPLFARTLDAVLGVAPGAYADDFGVAYAGSTSAENKYTLDGADVTDLRYGELGQTVPIEFIDETRVITGGAGPELATSIGGLVQASTKHGTNALHAGVFGAWAPSALAATARTVAAYPQTIEVTGEQAYAADVGAEVSGPIVKDRLWFYVGFAPQLAREDFTRRVRSEIDVNQDGGPDVDPKTGFPRTYVVDTQVREAPTRSYPTLARFDVAPASGQRGFLTLYAVPSDSASPGLAGLAQTGTRQDALATDIAADWRSRLLGGQLELHAQLGWHHASSEQSAYDPSAADQPQTVLFGATLADVAKYGGESAAAIAACTDGGKADPFPRITNCAPIAAYAIGGPGLLTREVQDRYSVQLAATAHVDAAGPHVVTVGAHADLRRLQLAQIYSGGSFVDESVSGPSEGSFVQTYRLVAVTPAGMQDLTTFDDAARTYDAHDAAVFARDVWRPRPQLALDLGVRVEDQSLLYGDDVRGSVDPSAGRSVPENLMQLRGELAPRLGVTYAAGGATWFAHWGRYFEEVPLDLASRAANDVRLRVDYMQCDASGHCVPVTSSLGGQILRAMPELRGEYVDEALAGGRVVVADTVLSAAVHDRRLGRAIEDVALAPDGATTLANPGEGAASAFDRAQREYDALELTATRALGPLYVQGSYTYARTFGDYTGSIGYLHDQLDPNFTTQYDLIELLANRRGVSPQDRTQRLAIDAAYAAPLGAHTVIVVGTRLRAESGIPELALASHYLYGSNESELIPAGAFGRTPFATELDLHLAVRRHVRASTAELYVDVLNVFDEQAAATVDNEYTTLPANPISGGTYADLVWAKQIEIDGAETNHPVQRNRTFHQPTTYYTPTFARVGFRVAF